MNPDTSEKPSALARLVTASSFHSLVAGGLVALSAPPFPGATTILALPGIVLFAITLSRAEKLRSATFRGFCFGLGMNLAALQFVMPTITKFTNLGVPAAITAWVLLSFAQSLAFAAAGLVFGLARRFTPTPLAFALGVAVATLSPQLFHWTLATPLARVPILLQLADVIGERGVAIIFALVAAMIAHTLVGPRPLRGRLLVTAASVPLVLVVYGWVRKGAIDARRTAAPKARIALVQHAIPPEDRWKPELAPYILEQLWSQTRAAQRDGASLVVWPEAAYPYVLSHEGGIDGGPERIRGPQIEVEVLAGALTTVPTDGGGNLGDRYNAAVLVDRYGHYGPPAAKMALLAFGEAVPLGETFPALRQIFARAGSLRPGTAVKLLSTTGPGPIVRAGILNCYEDILPTQARLVAAAGPNLLVNVTNDAWFGDTAEPDLHLSAAIARAIETRRDLVRAVNTGVTAHIDPFGRVLARAPRGARTMLMVSAALIEDGPTIYVRIGDVGWVVGLGLAAIGFAAGRRRRR